MAKTAPASEEKIVLPSAGGSYAREGEDLKRLEFTDAAEGAVGTQPVPAMASAADQAPAVDAPSTQE